MITTDVSYDLAFFAGWELANWSSRSRCPNSNITIADFSAALQLCWPPRGETKKQYIDKVSILLGEIEPQLESWFKIGLFSNGVIIESVAFKKSRSNALLNKLLKLQSRLALEFVSAGANFKERADVVTAVQKIFNDDDVSEGVGALVHSVNEIMSRTCQSVELLESIGVSEMVGQLDGDVMPDATGIKKEFVMTPTAFISYSWDDKAHQDWVKSLAMKLRENGVESILDKWHAVPGDQLPEFMENAIKNNDFVLMVCTPNYKKKSDARTGGVGYEGDIITGEVFVKRNQRKFIPVLAKGKWVESAPTWLTGKYYIDLSDKDLTSDNFSQLITTLRGENEVPPPVSKVSTSMSPPTSPLADRHLQKVISDVLDLFRTSTADVGHALNERAFLHRYIIKYNPKERSAIDSAIAKLEKEGVVEVKDGKVYLTQIGVDRIY